VQGYNLDMVQPQVPHNLAHLLVGSEGTLAWFRRLKLKLARLPAHKVLGVAHFPTFHRAMELTQQIVRLDPDAVELVDRTMIGLAREHAEFRPVVEQYFLGRPDAILLVEFAGDDRAEQLGKLDRLVELLADLGLPDAVVKVTDGRAQRDIWEVRKAGLNIMMSMKGDGKPVSFIEDCAVPLEHLAEYTQRLDEVFARHGTRGTWYAHASVGTLHVRPVLDMRRDGARQMRAIAEEACAMVKQYKGAFSGEHGDGLVRSEWIEPILGERLTHALGEIKDLLDPHNRFNPGKIVRPSRMDDRSLFRYPPGYATARSIPRSTGPTGAASAVRWRCATTTVIAASSMRARCAPPTARRATRFIPRAGAPTRCGSRSPGGSGPERSRPKPCTKRWTCASAARGASASAPPGSTWRASDRSAASALQVAREAAAREARRLSAPVCAVGFEGGTARQSP